MTNVFHLSQPEANAENESARAHGAHGGVIELGHGDTGGCDLIVTLPKAPSATQPATAREGGQQRLAKSLIHKAVDDGVDTGGGVREQVDEGDRSPRKSFVG